MMGLWRVKTSTCIELGSGIFAFYDSWQQFWLFLSGVTYDSSKSKSALEVRSHPQLNR
ncbi:hypothetical protein [Coleofasciculus sp. FACHB-SPT9]|uniref:hypothetical protein n=1 Tax=Cyanophyceae TaxID=3028117 RepID=UPI001684CA33|nr:hypothetical protein [Coleofasciculus sp. FACHB-SPT9]MBD1892118.1 hypothetical protein [Coleofasciculus sp. FACHB-SPT9]